MVRKYFRLDKLIKMWYSNILCKLNKHDLYCITYLFKDNVTGNNIFEWICLRCGKKFLKAKNNNFKIEQDSIEEEFKHIKELYERDKNVK